MVSRYRYPQQEPFTESAVRAIAEVAGVQVRQYLNNSMGLQVLLTYEGKDFYFGTDEELPGSLVLVDQDPGRTALVWQDYQPEGLLSLVYALKVVKGQ